MLAYLVTDFFGAFAPLWAAYEMADGDETGKAVLRKKGAADVHRQCAYLDALLRDQDWLLGERRSLADAYFAGISRWVEYMKLFDLGQEFPDLQRYLLRLKADPAITFARGIEDGEPAISRGGFRGHVTLEELVPRPGRDPSPRRSESSRAEFAPTGAAVRAAGRTGRCRFPYRRARRSVRGRSSTCRRA